MISQYQGELYPDDQAARCEAEFEQIVKKVESLKDFYVMEGGCFAQGQKHVRMKFTYSHSVMAQIERYERKLASNQICQTYVPNMSSIFVNAGYNVLHSYCEQENLRVDLVERSRNMIREVRFTSSFDKFEDCKTLVGNISSKLTQKGFTPIFANCAQVSSYNSNIHRYIPVLDYSAHFSNRVKVLNGKTLSSLGTCSEGNDEIVRQFNHTDLEAVAIYCAGLTQYIVYIEKNATDVKIFNGSEYSTQSSCETQLDRSVVALERAGHTVVYSFCQKTNQGNFQLANDSL